MMGKEGRIEACLLMSGVKNYLCRSRLFEEKFVNSKSCTKMEIRNVHYYHKRLIDYLLTCP
jgi:hypothetical protein